MQDDEPEMLRWLIGQFFKVFGLPEVAIEPTNSGWNGYDYRVNIGEHGQYGLIAFGGNNQRGTFHVELNATACALVTDWNTIRQWGESNEARITRVDLAHDDMEAKAVSIAMARAWYEAGEFTSNGRPPAAKLIDDMGSGKGKTLYIGSRESGKLLRVYEKGRHSDPSVLWRVSWNCAAKPRDTAGRAVLPPPLAGVIPVRTSPLSKTKSAPSKSLLKLRLNPCSDTSTRRGESPSMR
jgi:hypothetical protein